MFAIEHDFPSVEPPDYLRQLNPQLYEQECQRIQERFNEAVRLAEEAFVSELAKTVSHLTERLTGQVDGKPNQYRLTKPLYRAPGATVWEEKPWDWMVNTIADRVKKTRDAPGGFTTIDNPTVVNRCDKIASLGGGELDNEECYLLSKMNRALGVVYLEHCARI